MSEIARKAVELSGSVSERRGVSRERLVLRVGILENEERPLYCIIRNISPSGVQVRVFDELDIGADVTLRTGDEDPVRGRVVWLRDHVAGISFDQMLEPDRMLRVTQNPSPEKRRSSPRVSASAAAILSTGGRRYAAELCDISASGARARTRAPIIPGSCIVLSLPGLSPIRSYPRWVADQEVGLIFDAPLPLQAIAEWLRERVKVSVA